MEIYGIEYMPFEDCICQVWKKILKRIFTICLL
jgi:hypothetical protein